MSAETQPKPSCPDAPLSPPSSGWFRAARFCALAALFLSALLYPLQVPEEALERVLGSSFVNGEDIVDWPGLCSGIVDERGASKRALELFPLPSRQATLEVARGAEATPERRGKIVQGLNVLIQQRNLFSPKNMFSASPEMAATLRDGLRDAPPNARAERLLNRQSLQSVFPGAIADHYIFENLPGGSVLVALFGPYLRFQVSPLTLKEVAASLAILAALVFGCAGLLLRGRHPEGYWKNGRRFPLELTLFLALLAWALASMFRAPHFGLDSACLETALSLALWGLFALMLFRLPRPARFDRLAARCLVGVGLVVVAISAAQATRPFSTVLFKIMNDFAGPYQRNLFGSLIGHNTGVAVLAMGPFFFLLGGFLTERRLGRRVSFALAILLCLYCFAVTKSRFVWLALPFLTIAFLAALKSLTGARPSRRLVAGGLLILLLAAGWRLAPSGQSAGDAVRADYLARITSLRPSILLQGTRLRVLAISGDLVAQRPFAGHGLGAFAPLYPAAQANFFESHPDSRLKPSVALTQRAHNDYLQLLIETGLIGLGLALAALAVFLWRGVGRLRRLESPEERLRRLSALFGILSILLHATLDFPFHIAPIALFFIFYCVLFRGPSGEEPSLASHASGSATGRVARLVLVFSLGAVLLAGAFGAAWRLRFDHFFKRGSDALYHGLFLESHAAFSESLRIDPGHFEARMQLGICEKALAGGHYETARKAQQEGNIVLAGAHLEEAQDTLDSAFENLRSASKMSRFAPLPPEELGPLGPRLNHALLDALAQAWDLRVRVGPNDPTAPARYLACRAEAARYAPGVAEFLFDLLNRFDFADASAQKKRRRYIRQLDRYCRDEAAKNYHDMATRLVQEEQAKIAQSLLEEFLASVADPARYPDLHIALAKTQLALGRLDAFRATLRLTHERFPENPSLPLLDFIDLVRSEKLEAATALLEPMQKRLDEYWLFAYAEALAAQGGEKAKTAANLSRELLRRSPNPSLSLTLRGDVRRVVFGDSKGAAEFCRRALAYFPPFITTQDCLALLRLQAARGDWLAVRRTLHLVRESYAHSPALRALREQLLRQMAAAKSPTYRSAP